MKETIKALTKAFVGESQARNRYTFYAKVAKKEGYEQIAEIFLLTAEQEKEHAKRLFEHMNELIKKGVKKLEEIKVEAVAPTTLGGTVENLKAAIKGENYEHTEMYPNFSKVASKEGYSKIAKRLASIAIAESNHEERFKRFLKKIEKGTVFKNDKKVWWVCRECGYIHYGKEPPKNCPSCDHPQAYYEIRCEY